MPARRLTDRIRELCAKALDCHEPEWDANLRELQFAIQEHNLRLSNLSVAASISGQILPERRQPVDERSTHQTIRRLFAIAHAQKGRVASPQTQAWAEFLQPNKFFSSLKGLGQIAQRSLETENSILSPQELRRQDGVVRLGRSI